VLHVPLTLAQRQRHVAATGGEALRQRRRDLVVGGAVDEQDRDGQRRAADRRGLGERVAGLRVVVSRD
jgi:hypothetical protein